MLKVKCHKCKKSFESLLFGYEFWYKSDSIIEENIIDLSIADESITDLSFMSNYDWSEDKVLKELEGGFAIQCDHCKQMYKIKLDPVLE